MCDQDHFEKDRQEYEALGLVTRKQFGVMLGAGVAMMLPQVANAVTVTESGWTETRVLLGESGANGGPGVR
jgi:carboxymethylenebutenolidase